MRSKPYLIVSGSIFGLVTVVHLLRLIYGWTVQVGAIVVPEGASVVGLLVAAGLCAWAIRLACK